MQKNGEEPGYKAMSYDQLAAASPHNPLSADLGSLECVMVETEPLQLQLLKFVCLSNTILWPHNTSWP